METLRAAIPKVTEDRYLAPDLTLASALVRDGHLASAAGHEVLPRLEARQ